MKLHRNLVFAVIDGLDRIFNENLYADKVVEKLLKRDKRWGARDRGFIAETVYDIVRYKRLYAEIASVKEPFDRENLWRLFGVWVVLRGYSIPDWKQFQGLPKRKIKGKFDEFSKIRKYRASIPDWLDNLGVHELGEKIWTAEIDAMNKQADVIIRANSLKTSPEELSRLLGADQIETELLEEVPYGLRLLRRSNIFKTDAFSKGLFEVQDTSSQKVSAFLDVKPGMRVVDACAGAGGKTLHLAALMENKGQIIAMDIYPNKLKELKRRAKRNGAFNIETRVIESGKSIKKLFGKADRVLIDAPCSGLGVLRRNPDAKWKLKPEFIKEIVKTQAQILDSYSRMVTPGGKLVYATCSILPSENEKQVQRFLNSENGNSFSLCSEQHILVSESGNDGFYMALLKRNR